jgi:hypothetical protein
MGESLTIRKFILLVALMSEAGERKLLEEDEKVRKCVRK